VSSSEPLGERTAAQPEPPRVAFGPFVIEPETGRLLDGDREIPLAPRPFETLLYLAHRPGRVVSKAELLDSLWSDTHVTDDVLVQCVVEIRRALGDHARESRYIQTVPRRGYRFLGDARVLDPDTDGAETGIGDDAAHAAAGGAARSRLGAVIGLAVAAAVLGGWLVWDGRGDGLEAATPTRPGALLVTPVLVEGPEASGAWLHHGLAELMRAELGQRPGVHVVSGHRFAQMLAASEAGGAQPSPSQSLELARALGAEKLASGSFVRVKDRFVLTVQLVHVPTGITHGTAMVKGFYPDEVLDAVDELCVRILERWDAAELPRPDAVAWRPVRMATSSLDAFRHYSEALVWFARGGDRGAEEAERRLDQALQLDPRFAYAHLKKAEIQHWRRRHGYLAADPVPAVRAAAELLSEMPEREQLLVRLMEAALVEGDTDAAIRIYEDLTTRHLTFAEQVGVPSLLGDVFVQEGRWDRLVNLGLRHVESPSLPSSERALLASFLGRAFRQKGEFERAMAYAQRALRLWPTQDGPGFLRRRGERGRIALEGGLRERAIADFEAIAGDAGADAGSLTDAAWGFYMAGDAERAALVTERALDLDPGYGNAYHLRGWLALARGNHQAAARNLYTAFERTRRRVYGDVQFGFTSTESGDLAALYYAGVAEQKQKHAKRAAAHYREVIRISDAGPTTSHASEGGVLTWEAAYLSALALARLGEPVPRLPRLEGDDATFFLQSARLLAVMGEEGAALEHLREALRLTPGERQHVIDDPNFESLRDEAGFHALLGQSPSRIASR
jgi:DNA-binding winged helix-turn-helix (wHTH) protein/tetratricopeptide (TPR) repeat protein